MILDISGSLNLLKNQAILSILKNIDTRFELLNSDIKSKLKASSTSFESLLNLYEINYSKLASANVNALFMISYLDFYALYVILQSSYSSFKGLNDSSNSKYIYISSLFLDMFDMLNNKLLLKDYRYVSYVNFLNKSSVTFEDIGNITRGKKLFDILSTDGVLSLPISESTEFAPSEISYEGIDISSHELIDNSTYKSVSYNIYRKQLNKICIVDSVVSNSSNFVTRVVPDILGTIYGYYSDMLYIIISSIDKTGDIVNSFKIKGSIDGSEWSSESEGTIGTYLPLLIEGDIDTGIKICFNNHEIEEGDIWSINLSRISLPDPSINVSIKFDMFENISYLSLSDISEYRLDINSYKIRHKKFASFEDIETYYDDNYIKLVTINDQINELKLGLTQKDCNIATYNSKLVNNYDFKIEDIKAISNEYLSQGTINFNKIDVSLIRDVSLEAKEYLYQPTENYSTKQYIEYNIFASSETDKILIPILPKENNTTINEFIIPSMAGNYYSYKPRFPVDISQPIKIKNLYTNEETIAASGFADDHMCYYDELPQTIRETSEYMLTIYMRDYDEQYGYQISYTPKVYTSIDTYNNAKFDRTEESTYTKWIIYNNIYYMYYKDKNNKNCLAIRDASGTTLKGFTGSVVSNIEMRSLEPKFISPFVYEYKLLIN